MILIGAVIAVLMVLALPHIYPAQAVTAGRGFAGPATLARGPLTRSGDTTNARTSHGGWQA